MTQKEKKASELVESFMKNGNLSLSEAKDSAVICVEEIIKALSRTILNSYSVLNFNSNVSYWEGVINHIKKI